MSSNSCIKAIIDLAAIRENYLTYRKLLKQNTVCAAVLKNDAYGLGAKKVAHTLYEAGCRSFWVAYLAEGIELRSVLPRDAQIYTLQSFSKNDIHQIKMYNIIPIVNSAIEFKMALDCDLIFGLHVDTGLNRLGIREDEIDCILDNLAHEKIEYVISHLACSDDMQATKNYEQKAKFEKIIAKIKQKNPKIKYGISASSGIFIGKAFEYDIVRVGAFLYGINGSNSSGAINPKNVLSIKSKILQNFYVSKGDSVGYGEAFVCSSDMRISIVSIGYGDGISRNLSNKGKVILRGKDGTIYTCPIVGSLSMDLLACDTSCVPAELIHELAEVYLLDHNYSINEMAVDANTIPYEILSNIKFNSIRFGIEYKE